MKIVSQFKGFSISGWSDEYLLVSSKDFSESTKIIADFFEIEIIGKYYEGFCVFLRGSTLGTWVAHTEKAPKQTVSFKETIEGILLRYQIHPGLFLRIPPYGLEKDARELEFLLN